MGIEWGGEDMTKYVRREIVVLSAQHAAFFSTIPLPPLVLCDYVWTTPAGPHWQAVGEPYTCNAERF